MADQRAKRIAEFIEPLRVKPGSTVTLRKDFDPRYKAGIANKAEGVELLTTASSSSPSTRSVSPRRTPGASWCVSRRWTPAARTARSATS